MLLEVSVSIDVVVATNSRDLSLSCLETLLKYASNAEKTDAKYRRIKKANDIYQAPCHLFPSLQYITLQFV
jgi:hypothetical protein